jgi:hypothetical protein
MTWHVLEAHHRFDPCVAKSLAVQGRKWSMADMKHLGPEWWGEHQHLNPLWESRPRALLYGIITVGGFVLALFGAIQGIIPRGSVSMLAYFMLPLGLTALAYFFLVPKFLVGRWRLSAQRDTLTYESPGIVGELLELALAGPFGDVLQRLGVSANLRGWSVSSASIARIETGPTADWQPLRRYGLFEKPVPRDEVQAFLFLADGSRRVIANVHGGRESMAMLTQSIRSWLDQQRQGERLASQERGSVAMLESGEGFNI